MKKIKILLIEDNRLLSDGIISLSKKQSDMSVTATEGNSENILKTIEKLKPVIILLDIGLRNQNSLQLVKMVVQHFPKIKIIVMDLIPLHTDVFEFVEAGVSGFILKDANIAEFFKTIRAVYHGIKILPSHLTGSLFSQIIEHALNKTKPAVVADSIRMTKREHQVIELISDGMTNKEIAQKLNLSTYTIKSHVHNILEKLAFNTRVQIAKYAIHQTPSKTR